VERRDGMRAVIRRLGNEPIIANQGPTLCDLFALGDRDANLYVASAMGLVSSLGLGVALAAPDRRVIVMDGDGGLLMNLGSLATIARLQPRNLLHIVWDNHMWGGTGGQPSHTATGTDLAAVARAAGIQHAVAVSSLAQLEEALDGAFSADGPWCIVASIEEGGHAPHPTLEPEHNLHRFRGTF
jgi:sulfopyruvate decarboxylase subunit beta